MLSGMAEDAEIIELDDRRPAPFDWSYVAEMLDGCERMRALGERPLMSSPAWRLRVVD